MSYTPGPHEIDYYHREPRAVKLKVADGRGVCYWRPDNDHYPTRDGDFHLFAMAPVLLEACKADEAYLEHVADCPFCDAGNCETGVRLGAMARGLRRAAIAGAEKEG